MYREICDHDDVGKQNQHRCKRFGENEIVQELYILAVVMVEVLPISDLAVVRLYLLHDF
jgi:hypothetical protein